MVEILEDSVLKTAVASKISSDNLVKSLVSKKKKRYILDGVNLDLTCNPFFIRY